MKITNDSIYSLFSNKPLFEKFENTEMLIESAYKRIKNLSKLLPIFQNIEKVKYELLQKYGENDGSGNLIVDINKNQEKYNLFIEEFFKILSLEEEVDIEKFALSEMPSLYLTNTDFRVLSFLIKMPEDLGTSEVKKEK